MNRKLIAGAGIFWMAQVAVAGTPTQTPLGQSLGIRLGEALSSVLPEALGSALPAGIGGVAGFTALTLIVGAQLIKRRRR